ncbi:MAG: acetate--CoA ligase family protein, partial [Candidatus Dormibacteraeota bacterium]|nr:acetate--CoA ligase family protein [Candidatus Dormibacteraeota bacterium]
PVQAELLKAIPTAASGANPVDLRAEAEPAAFDTAIRVVGGSGAVDSLVVVYTPTVSNAAPQVAARVAEAARDLPAAVTVASVFLGAGRLSRIRAMTGRVPVFGFPEQAARALAAAARYGRWRREPLGQIPHLDGIDEGAGRSVVEAALGRGGGWLQPGEMLTLLRAYGLPLVGGGLVETPEEAGELAGRLGGAVALKGLGAAIVHKTELGAVRLGLEGGDAVRDAAAGMRDRLRQEGAEVERFWVQRMAPTGVEMLVGLARDPTFGPLLACGAGGTNAELLGDVQARITPLTDRDASDMLRRLRTRRLLDGWRGAPPADVEALTDVLLRVSALAEAVPEIEEMDLNPVVCTPEGACIVDARVHVAPARPRPLLGAR